jgi:hypothetical protein
VSLCYLYAFKIDLRTVSQVVVLLHYVKDTFNYHHSVIGLCCCQTLISATMRPPLSSIILPFNRNFL